MDTTDEPLIPVFMPELSLLLLRAEDLKESPLTIEEVIKIRDEAPCIMMYEEDARKMEATRGKQIDPENCWHDWQLLRRELGRKPDLDPGPKFFQVRSADPEYQKTIEDARSSLVRFRAMLPSDGSPRFDAMVKTKVVNEQDHAFMWLCNARISGSDFIAEFFEVPFPESDIKVGEEYLVTEDLLLDWMVNNEGILHGRFSLRYQRSKVPQDERQEYDEYIGVTTYA